MDKIAAYKLLLNNHPLWSKEAESKVRRAFIATNKAISRHGKELVNRTMRKVGPEVRKNSQRIAEKVTPSVQRVSAALERTAKSVGRRTRQ